MSTEYDSDRVMECMLDETTSGIIKELEGGAKTCVYLAGAASVSEDDVVSRLQYMVECGFIICGSDASGNMTFEADQEKLARMMEDGENFGAAISGIEKMDSYLN